jgi:UDP-GlcNAc:undecaprenyl-phosphate/decaprenyl-phosphate GlcNAc-1-phosphate transferase
VTRAFTICLVSFGATAALVPLVRGLARRRGLHSQPASDRWHRRAVPKLGGVAMAAALLPLAYFSAEAPALRLLPILSALMFGVGLVDDVRPLGPATKFCGQSIAAVIFLSLAPAVRITGLPSLDLAASFLWLVGITNAFNLLDNIDGLAAGAAAIAGTFLVAGITAGGSASSHVAVPLAALVGAAAGFLIYNWKPASIFMGDSGSHLLGSFIAGATLLSAPAGTTRLESLIAIGAVLLLPMADTTLVVLTRVLARRSPFIGGRDHASHRLIALEIGERRAVLSLYAVALSGGAVALASLYVPPAIGWTAVTVYVASIVSAGVYLGRVRIPFTAERAPGRQIPDTPLRVRPRDAIAAASRARAVRVNPIP